MAKCPRTCLIRCGFTNCNWCISLDNVLILPLFFLSNKFRLTRCRCNRKAAHKSCNSEIVFNSVFNFFTTLHLRKYTYYISNDPSRKIVFDFSFCKLLSRLVFRDCLPLYRYFSSPSAPDESRTRMTPTVSTGDT